MVRLFVRHRVADFATWKKGYDSFEGARRKSGVRAAAIFRGVVDPREVTVWHDFDDLPAAQAFLRAPELAAAMKSAGVASEPETWFVDRDLPA